MTTVAPSGFVKPCLPWVDETDFVCNEKPLCGNSPCPDGYVSPWSDVDWLDMATSTLFVLTGSRFTSCARTVMPRPVCACELIDCQTCGVYPTIDLGSGVVKILQIFDNGVLLDPASYRVDSGRWLVRLDTGTGNRGWPRTNRIDSIPGGPGTFEVTYLEGHDLPPGAAQAAVALACALKMSGGITTTAVVRGQTTTNVNTRGFSASTQGLLAGLADGKSGIMIVDVFLATWLVKRENQRGETINAGGLVWSPEVAATKHIETTFWNGP